MNNVTIKTINVFVVIVLICLLWYTFHLYVESVEQNAICDERGGVLVETYEFVGSSVCLDRKSIIEI